MREITLDTYQTAICDKYYLFSNKWNEFGTITRSEYMSGGFTLLCFDYITKGNHFGENHYDTLHQILLSFLRNQANSFYEFDSFYEMITYYSEKKNV